jgi:DegV family protein with EDD domain
VDIVNKVCIVTDSAASIPEGMIDELQIRWVPYYIHRGKEVFRDMVTIHREEFYSWLVTATELPKTACPGPGDYFTTYKNLAEEDGVEEIISIHMTSKGSGAYQAALVGKSMIQETIPWLKIEVIDTLNVSLCQGWMVIEAARAAMKGLSMGDLIDLIYNMIPKVKMIQTADTLRYLYMGGRIGRAKYLLASFLNVKPLISMEDGIIVALGQALTRQKAYEKMVEIVENAVGPGGKIKIAYVHAACREEAEKIKGLMEVRVNCVESFIAELSPVLGVHTGPGTAGFCYYPVSESSLR